MAATAEKFEADTDRAFVVKVFSHWLHTEEESEVRDVRIQNIENEN